MKKTISVALAILLFCGGFFALQHLLMPKYMSKPFEGALTAEYYGDEHRNDLLIIGDCEVYENISPLTLWEQAGIPSYIRGTAKQLMWQSRALLEDALRYETPKVVLLSVLAMMYGAPPHDIETYNRMTLDGMPLSGIKVRAVRDSMLPEEEALSYLFPLLRFHSRWKELDREDLRYYFRKEQVSLNGFVMRVDSLPAGWTPTPARLPDYAFGKQAMEALEAMTALCKEKGIQLVLFKAPSLMPHWYEEWEAQIVDYAARHELLYLNALAITEEIGLDYREDTYDGGLHLNLSGAEKMAGYLGPWLLEHCPALRDRRGEPELDAIWAAKAVQYRTLKAAQEDELAREGKVSTFIVPHTF